MSNIFDDNDQFIGQFIIEAEEHIDSIETSLLELEKALISSDTVNPETINELFRSIHTIKGISGMLDFNALSTLTHSWETLLDKIRKKKKELNSHVIDVSFEGLDVLIQIISNIKKNKTDKDVSITEVVEKIENVINEDENAQKIIEAIDPITALSVLFQKQLLEFEKEKLSEEIAKESSIYEIRLNLNKDCFDSGLSYMSICINLELIGEIINISPNIELIPNLENFEPSLFDLEIDILFSSNKDLERIYSALKNKDIRVEKVDFQRKVELLEGQKQEIEDFVPQAKKEVEQPKVVKREAHIDKIEKEINLKLKKGNSTNQDTIRVETGRLDNILDLLGEQVISKTQLEHLIGELTNLVKSKNNNFNFDLLEKISESLNETIGTFSRLNNDLQENVMRIRMLPIGNVFNRFNRVVRDLSKELGKQVNLVVEGEDTELDKTIIEEISDPLIHIIRNAIDHGIELPDERIAKGKSPEGILHFNAYQQGNSIVITIKDDGKGLKLDVIKNKAIEKGLIEPDIKLSDKEVMNLIFLPGFSTAKEVTGISGRGVGMDVVRKNVANLRGTIEIDSEENKGTTFILKLPLTLAIIQALLIKVSNAVFAVPLSSVIESYRATKEEIRIVNDKPIIKLREEILPILYFQDYFKMPKQEEAKKYLYVVVIGAAENKAGFIVDKLVGQQEIVIKPLKDPLVRIRGIAGATLIGEGVTLIVDPTPIIFEGQGSKSFNNSGML